MDPSSWAETCLSNLGSKWSPRMEGGMQECPQPVPAVAPLAAVSLLGRALTWAEHGPAEELNCAFAVLHRNIWLKAYRKISEEEFCSGNINLILHEVKSIFVVWVLSQGLKAMCCSISPSLGYLPPFPPQTTAVFMGKLHFSGLCLWTAYMNFAPNHCPYKTLGWWISAQWKFKCCKLKANLAWCVPPLQSARNYFFQLSSSQ